MYIEVLRQGESEGKKIIELDSEALIDLLRHGKVEFQNIIIKVI